MHINQKQLKAKISIFMGRASEKNNQVLEVIALNGPLLKYDVNRFVGWHYSTVSRRIDDLNRRGYLTESGTRKTQKGDQETLFGLSWSGLIASLISENVRANIFNVIELNMETLQTGKNTFIKFSQIFSLLKKISTVYNEEQIAVFVKSLFLGYLSSSAPSLENMMEIADYPGVDNLMWSMMVLQQSFQYMSDENGENAVDILDVVKLVDDPEVLELVRVSAPLISMAFREGIEKQYLMTVYLPEQIGLVLDNLSSGDIASEKVKEMLDEEFGKEFSLEVKSE